MDDAIVGAAATIPARNSPTLDWSNYDVTFFCGFDQVTSPAFENRQSGRPRLRRHHVHRSQGRLHRGRLRLPRRPRQHRPQLQQRRPLLHPPLLEPGFQLDARDRQCRPGRARRRPHRRTACSLIAENSFLTPWPYNVIPYVNLWVGFDDPQSVARAGAAGGVLRNVGILFETDNLTGYPTLDATGNDTYGAAIGLDLLAPEFTHQLIVEAAVLQVFGDPADRNAPGDQYGVGMPLPGAHLERHAPPLRRHARLVRKHRRRQRRPRRIPLEVLTT